MSKNFENLHKPGDEYGQVFIVSLFIVRANEDVRTHSPISQQNIEFKDLPDFIRTNIIKASKGLLEGVPKGVDPILKSGIMTSPINETDNTKTQITWQQLPNT